MLASLNLKTPPTILTQKNTKINKNDELVYSTSSRFHISGYPEILIYSDSITNPFLTYSHCQSDVTTKYQHTNNSFSQ